MEKSQTKKHGKRYDRDLKLEAVRQVREGKSFSSVSQAVGASEPTIRAWASSKKLEGAVVAAPSQSETARLRQELDALKVEHRAMKETLSYIITHAKELWG